MENLTKTDRKILGDLYVASLLGGLKGHEKISGRMEIDEKELERKFESFCDRGLARLSDRVYTLTDKGRKSITIVMAGGAFDIIHPGHVETLEKSKALGDILVVSVARDVTFERNKKRKPIHSEELRRKLVLSLKAVDAAILGSKTDIFETVEFVKPDIIAIGYDQSHSEEKIEEIARARGVKVRVVRLESSVPWIKSSKIISKETGILGES